MPKLPTQIIGSFVFRHEGDGCLTSKYHHGDSAECPFTEACKLITTAMPNDRFVGTYRTVWLEDNNTHIPAELLIERHSVNPNLFKLTWYEPGLPSNIIFWGTGMLFDNLLSGTYWD